jgi:membrane-associated phospholipid phosphatase
MPVLASGPQADPSTRNTRWLALVLNTIITFGLYEIYELTRGLIPRNGPIALSHARAVWGWEVRHGLFVEPAWQQFWLKKEHILGWLHLNPDQVEEFLNTGYLYVHFIGTISFLFWLFLFRHPIFAFVRNVFFVTTGIALLTYMLYPLAPPRLATNLFYDNRHYTFVDTVQKVLGAIPQTSEIGYNPYAAMPSLHFGWALIIGGTLFLTLRRVPLRLLALCYPAFMLAIIVISGNHFFVDALGSTVVVAVAVGMVYLWHSWRGTLPWKRPLDDAQPVPIVLVAP